MKQVKTRVRRQAQNGSIAIETIFCLPLLILFLAVPLYMAQIFWYYSVAQKAAHDGARFLASVPQTEIVAAAGNGGAKLPVAALAEQIAHEEIADIKGALVWWSIEAQCDTLACGGAVPQTVRVSVQIKMEVPVVGSFAGASFGDDGLLLKVPVTMRYLGN